MNNDLAGEAAYGMGVRENARLEALICDSICGVTKVPMGSRRRPNN